jgi:hypothetical protein
MDTQKNVYERKDGGKGRENKKEKMKNENEYIKNTHFYFIFHAV